MAAPDWCDTPKLREYWREPWSRGARQSRVFKHRCWEHGYVSPNFTRAEWKCHDGTPVPDSLKPNAQRHGFHLERFRHELGDPSLPILSAYRTPSYNSSIGGASQSRHMSADATDFDVSTVNRIGASKFDQTADRVFSNGGFGQYPGGSRHVDSRGYKARWTSF